MAADLQLTPDIVQDWALNNVWICRCYGHSSQWLVWSTNTKLWQVR